MSLWIPHLKLLLAQDKVKILLYDFDEDQAEKKKLPAGLSKQEQMDALANTAFDELIGWVDMTVEQLYANLAYSSSERRSLWNASKHHLSTQMYTSQP